MNQNRKHFSGGTNLSTVFLESAIRKTGKSLESWFKALDTFNINSYKHAVLVSHLMEAYNLGQWEADAIVHSYCAAKGLSSPPKDHKGHRPPRRRKKKRSINSD